MRKFLLTHYDHFYYNFKIKHSYIFLREEQTCSNAGTQSQGPLDEAAQPPNRISNLIIKLCRPIPSRGNRPFSFNVKRRELIHYGFIWQEAKTCLPQQSRVSCA